MALQSAVSAHTGLDAYPLSHATRRFLEESLLGHLIDGELVPSRSNATMPVFEPSSGREFTRVAAGDAQDVELAVRAACQAHEDGRWRLLPPSEREARLRRLAMLLEANRDVLMDLDVLEGGVIRSFSQFTVQFGIDITHYYAGWPTKIHGTVPATAPGLVVQEVREPIGVCAVITPWNGPSAIPLLILPPLACGNSVVLKPAEQTPLTALFVARLCSEAGMPSGTLNVVQGVGERVGAALVEHPLVDAISFTGSVETGRKIQAAAAKGLKRVTLELGGKSPHIIFNDADLEAAVPAAASAIWGHAGQICIAGSRILVQRDIHDQFVDRLVAVSKSMKIGSGFDSATELGPLISREQLERVCRYVAIGREEGARLVLGGERHGTEGYFHQPTIFTSVRNDMTIAREEIFGPVAVVIPFDNEQEAYAIANDTEFGLAAGVWTRDLARAHRATQRLRAGTVWVNTYLRVEPGISYGGVKQSGIGRNLGHASIDDFTQVRSLWFNIA